MFYFDKVLNKEVLKSDLLKGVNHFFTTKEILLKTKEEKNVNLALLNRKLLKEEFNLQKIVTPKQCHTDNIEVVSFDRNEYENCDGLILKDKNIGIFLNFADCTPLIFYDSKNKIAAISHAGWRGTSQKIGPKTVKLMVDNFGSTLESISVLIGPCICYDCFETGYEVIEKLSKTVKNYKNYIKNKNGKFYADLKGINKAQLNEIGVFKIDVSLFCTCCNNDKFYSYRLENKTTNRMSAFISL